MNKRTLSKHIRLVILLDSYLEDNIGYKDLWLQSYAETL